LLFENVRCYLWNKTLCLIYAALIVSRQEKTTAVCQPYVRPSVRHLLLDGCMGMETANSLLPWGWQQQTRSNPEMVGDMSCVTLNFDLSKIPLLCVFSQGQDLYSHQKLNIVHSAVLMWERLQTPDATVQLSTTTKATYRQ